MTEGASASTSSSIDGDSSTTGGILTDVDCPVGGLDCPCTPGGACDATLACELGMCIEGCAIGSLGCACTQGGTCDGGLACEAGACVEGVSATCGDGVLDEFEECDNGENNGVSNGDNKSCTSMCKLARCGDGLVGPGEACDGGEGCTRLCALSTCGDGKLDPGEDCEPTDVDDLECTAVCTDARKVIFVTSEHYKGGEIGGIAGGDAKCQALADAAGLPGVFLASLGTTKENDPGKRFTWHEGVLFVDTSGAVLATSGVGSYPYNSPLPILTETGDMSAPSELEHPVVGQVPPGWMFVAWSAWFLYPTENHCGGWSDIAAKGAVVPFGLGYKPAWLGAPCDKRAPLLCWEQ